MWTNTPNMEATSPASPNGNKRKSLVPAEYERTKRLKTIQECDHVPLDVHRAHSPRISVLLENLKQPVTLNELTELLHYAALGKSVKKPSWCRFHKQRKVQGVNVVIVEDVTQSHFYKHYLSLPNLRKNYPTRVTFTPSSHNVASGIFSSEVTKSDSSALFQTEEESYRIHKALKRHPVITKFGTERRGLTAYVLSQEEMIKNNYPVKGLPGCEEFVCTDSADFVTDSSPLYGLDCEMCLTAKGNELSRVSLVDSSGNCLLDELVKPPNRIFNYLTKFSGITAEMLRPIKTTLRDVQQKLGALLPRDAVLVGHSLHCDLRALKMIHQHVIDTSLLYRKEFGQKFKLKVLAETLLKRQIQTDDKMGHNPTEDAAAAVELAQYFIKTGPCKIVESHLEELWGYAIEDESASECTPAPPPSTRFSDVLHMLGRSVTFSGKRSDVVLELSKQQWHKSDKEVLDSFRTQTTCAFFSVLQLSSFSEPLSTGLPHQQLHRMFSSLRDMCVVFAGPFPPGFSEKDVRRLFRCCGPVHKIKLLNTTVRVHAEVEFELLEAALVALKTLNGVKVQGQSIKSHWGFCRSLKSLDSKIKLLPCPPEGEVQRPVNESTLDLDVTLDALMSDSVNSSRLYAVQVKPNPAEDPHRTAQLNGHTSHSLASNVKNSCNQTKVNGSKGETSDLWEETFRETFSRFGSVETIVLPRKPGKRSQHACIEFHRSESRQAALDSSEDLRRHNYLICPSLTPAHLPSWVSMATPATTADIDGGVAVDDQEMERKMRKLDRHLGKVFRFLPEGMLSVVLLLGHTSAHGHSPGLCLLDVKKTPTQTG